MAYRFKRKCSKCGAFLQINETNDYAPGCKDREEVNCPKCGHEVYHTMTSGHLEISEISESDFNSKSDV